MYVRTYLIHLLCIYFALRLLQKCLPGLVLSRRASPVSSCSFSCSPRTRAVNQRWHMPSLTHLAVLAGHFQESYNTGGQYQHHGCPPSSPPSICTCELGLCVVCARVCGLHLQRESGRHRGTALGSFSCRPMVWGWGEEIIASLRSGWPWSFLHLPVPATKLSIIWAWWLTSSEEKQRLLAVYVHSCCTSIQNLLKLNLLACRVRHRHPCQQHRPGVFLHFSSHYHPPCPPPLPVLSNLTSHLLSLTYMFPLREESEAWVKG